MIKSFQRCGFAGFILYTSFLTPFANVAQATEVLAVESDRSIVLTMPASPGAVIIGNPSIADVSVNADKLFVHGRAFGQTNLIIMDLQGNEIMHYDLVVRNSAESVVAVYGPGDQFKAGGPTRRSYTCLPNCEAQFQIGDEEKFFSTTIGQAQDKLKFGTGNQSAEAAAPAAPQ